MVDYNWGGITDDFSAVTLNKLQLEGAGYFTLGTFDPLSGDLATCFTRSGQFSIDANGGIISAEGCFLLGFGPYETSYDLANLSPLAVKAQRSYGAIVVDLPQGSVEGSVVYLEWPINGWDPLTHVVTFDDITNGSVTFNGYSFLSAEVAALLTPVCAWTQVRVDVPGSYRVNQLVTVENGTGQTWSKAIEASDLARGFLSIDLPLLTPDETDLLIVKTTAGATSTVIGSTHISFVDKTQSTPSQFEDVLGVGIIISLEGNVCEVFSDGEQEQIGTVALSNFANANELSVVGGGVLAATVQSGEPIIVNVGDPIAQSVVVGVIDPNNIQFKSAATASVVENITPATPFYTAIATDPKSNASLTYSISGGTDADLFNINAMTGAITFKAPPNFEAPADFGGDNVYDIRVHAEDGALAADRALAITVTNINEAPIINSAATSTTPEGVNNATAVYIVTATDQDTNAILTYAIQGGADANLFKIDALTGAVTFKASPDFEAPADSGADNVYDIIVQVSDGALSATKNVAVTVTDVFEGGSTVRDFNADGRSDVLLQNVNDGACYTWELNGTSLLTHGYAGWAPGASWQAKGTGDFNGDGKSDVLLQNANDGSCYIWELNGTTLVGNGYAGWTPGSAWQAKGTGDFNGDGKSDVLLQNANDGSCYIWELNGTTLVGNGYAGWTPGSAWQAKGTGDFNGDGKSDILLQNANDGSCYIWELNGTSLVGNGYVGWAPGSAWQAKGTGDFNGDGKSDVLLQNANDGTCYIWELNGTTLVGNGYAGWTPGADWHAVA